MAAHECTRGDNGMVQDAIRFARKTHAGRFRKGTDRPMIHHALAAADIVLNIRPEESLITAALLHDAVEEGDITLKELSEKFGFRVANIVAAQSDDESLSWTDRKRKKLKELEKASEDVKIVTLGDELSNLRDLAADYAEMGDEIWNRISPVGREWLGWYYIGLRRSLLSLAYLFYYQEFSVLITGLFEETSGKALIS